MATGMLQPGSTMSLPCPLHPVPLTFPHEASLAVVHDLNGDEGVVGHGIVAHGGEAAVLLQGCQCLRFQWAAQKGAEPLCGATQVLQRGGQSDHGSHGDRDGDRDTPGLTWCSSS